MTLHSPREDVRDPRGLWWWMRFFVLLTILGYAATAVLSGATWSIYARVFHFSLPQARAIDTGINLTNVAVLATYVFSIIFTLRVTYRLMKNAHAFGDEPDMFSPGMAVGWYFVPLANLALPPRAVGQIWRATFRRIGQSERSSVIVGWWWMTWIGSGILLTVVSVLTRGARGYDHDTTQLALLVQTIGFAFRVVAAVLLLVVFGTLVRAQSNLESVADTFD